jgi:hypothetical protein
VASAVAYRRKIAIRNLFSINAATENLAVAIALSSRSIYVFGRVASAKCSIIDLFERKMPFGDDLVELIDFIGIQTHVAVDLELSFTQQSEW